MSRPSTQDDHTSWWGVLKPNDIGLNQITKNWMEFLTVNLKHPLNDGLTPLRRECAFVILLEGGGEWVINKFEKGFELVTKVQMYVTIDSTSKVTH